jgi:tetratricopeptide (TPR) repeat protein
LYRIVERAGVDIILRNCKIVAAMIASCLTFFGFTAFSSSTQSENDEVKQKAQTYFLRGELLFENGEYLKAAEAFTLAYETLPHHAVLANIGLAYERSGAYHLAIVHCRKYLDAIGKIGEKNPRIEALLKGMLEKVAELRISAECPPATCHIHIDSVDHGEAPVQAVVLPGEHNLMAVRDRRIVATKKLTVNAGETAKVELYDETTPDDSFPADNRRRRPKLTAPFWISAGVAVAAGISAGVLWGATFSAKRDFDNASDRTDLYHLKEVGERRQIGAIVATGMAGVAAVTAAVFASVGILKERRSQATHVSVAPGLGGVVIQY